MRKKTSVASPARCISVAWEPFALTLAKVLGGLQEDQFLIISAKHSNHYVQFMAQGSYGMRVETTSNAYLGKEEKLEHEQLQALKMLGWNVPTGKPQDATPEKQPDGSPNYFREFPAPIDENAIAKLALDTLVHVLRIPHPGMLEYDASELDGERSFPLAFGDLGLKRVCRDENIYDPGQLPNLVMLLLETIRQITGISDLDFDGGGDVAVRYGSMVVYARVVGEPPLITLFSPLVIEVAEAPAVYERLNEINGRNSLMRLFWREGTIYALVEIPAWPYESSHVVTTFKAFTRIANELDDLLSADLGGRTTGYEWIPSTSRH
jgi:hypothetical protein